MRRNYTTIREMQPSTDGSKKATYSGMAPSDRIHRPVLMDPGGRQIQIIRYASSLNGERYVIEEIVEHSVVPAPVSRILVSESRFSSEEPLDSAFDRPEKVEEFITKVLTETSRGPTRPVAPPPTSAWHSGPNRIVQENRKYGEERDFGGDDRKRLNGSLNLDKRNEPYLNTKGANTQPMIRNNRDAYDLCERPQVYEGSNARNHLLNKPTTDIGTAVDFLKLAIKPSYRNGKEKEFNANAQAEGSRAPAKPFPLSSMGRRTGSNLSGPDTSKVESEDDDSEEEESQYLRYGKRDELKPVKNRGGAKPVQNKDGYENPKGTGAAVQFGQRFPGSTMQKKERNSYPETIDSREASRRYGKSSSRPMEEEHYKGTISSKEAELKYNGAPVP